MQPVKYSVIIPVYNAEKTLRSCVDSVVHDSENVSEIEVYRSQFCHMRRVFATQQ